MAALPADRVDPALNLEAFPFFYSDEFSEITEEDYLRAEPDVNYILPDAQARLTTRRDLLAELAFALLNRESPDYIAEEHPPRVRNLTYNNHVTSETWLQWRKSSAPASRKLKLSNLKGLVDLPFEILALIFDDLHPIDYLHLAQTCKHLRFFFSSRANRSLWRAAFLRFERIPECPPDFIEPRWAAFMWGKDSCDVCGGIKSAPEWNLRRRLCNPCLEANTIKPDENAGPAFAYLPASADGERYWQEDVLETEMEFEKFTIRASVEGYMAEMEMTMYMDQKTALLLLIKEHGDICRRWARHLHNDHDARQDKKKEAVVKRIRTLFRLEGHHKDDADQATITIDDDEKIAHRYLTRYHFNDLRPRFTDAIQEACRNRLQREHDRAVIDRGWAITERVNEWMRSNPAWTWGYQPYNNAFVKNFPHIFQDLVDAEGSAPITTDDMVTAFEKVDEEIVKWRLKKMEELADMLPEEEYVHDLYNEGMSEKANIGSLELATAVFDCECGGGHAYVGWDEAGEAYISLHDSIFEKRSGCSEILG
ncbi:hypothetical protein DL96DRAFT_22924 [Flagelloscypha sp. PMI_526]|nr:hypothetical protein DL96DRAFT_22924 [Flagelloscypha sp. PMI_526]